MLMCTLIPCVRQVLFYGNISFTTFFTLEMLAKIITVGFFHPAETAYVRKYGVASTIMWTLKEFAVVGGISWT